MTVFSVLIYSLIRLASFFTYHQPIANQIIAGIVIVSFGYFCFKNPKLAWIMLLGELILDGAGHFFELHSLLLRTWFLAIFATTWLLSKLKTKQLIWPPAPILISSLGLLFIVLLATFNGFYHEHNTTSILQDLITYLFLGLVWPALEWGQSVQKTVLNFLKAWIIGAAFFSLITYFIYASGLGFLPDNYYHWFRNIASGKITDLGNHFFRIVLPEQILIIPIILIISAYLIRDPKNKTLWFLQLSSVLILTLNFSRIYFLALVIGFLILTIKQSFKRWLLITTVTIFSTLIIFSTLNLVASRGQTAGLELVGLRFGKNANPTTDVSGAIRLSILPDAIEQIKSRPLWGSGLGATVTYLDPATKIKVTRTQFDWGYLEMLAELGLIGTLVFLIFLISLIKQTSQKAYFSKINSPIHQGLLAGTAALIIINITTPALFHGFGILYFVIMITLANDVSEQSPDAPPGIV